MRDRSNQVLSSESQDQSNSNLRKEYLDPRLHRHDTNNQKSKLSAKKLTKRSEDIHSNASFEENMKNRYASSKHGSPNDGHLKVLKRVQLEDKPQNIESDQFNV